MKLLVFTFFLCLIIGFIAAGVVQSTQGTSASQANTNATSASHANNNATSASQANNNATSEQKVMKFISYKMFKIFHLLFLPRVQPTQQQQPEDYSDDDLDNVDWNGAWAMQNGVFERWQ